MCKFIIIGVGGGRSLGASSGKNGREPIFKKVLCLAA